MNFFLLKITISIVMYYVIRIFYKNEKSLYIAALVSSGLFVCMYLIDYMSLLKYEEISVISNLHLISVGLSILFLFIAYNEIIILEIKVRNLKKGELIERQPFPVERNYKILNKLLGISLLFLSFVFISGLANTSIVDANIVFKALFTLIAWLIYVITFVGIKFFNFPIKYATRSLFVAMLAVIAAYYMNSYLTEL